MELKSRCLRYCKSTIFQANHNIKLEWWDNDELFAILQKYDFSSKSQLASIPEVLTSSCLRYCKSTIFQANHNALRSFTQSRKVVCDTAKVRFFKQITTWMAGVLVNKCCLRYCKSTIFQANHNDPKEVCWIARVVCDTAKVRFFKQITTGQLLLLIAKCCLRYCKSTIFQANHNVKMINLR